MLLHNRLLTSDRDVIFSREGVDMLKHVEGDHRSGSPFSLERVDRYLSIQGLPHKSMPDRVEHHTCPDPSP